MAILACVFSGFVAALAAPLLSRHSTRAAGWLLAVLPAAIFAYFVAQIGIDKPIRVTYAWVPALDVSLSFNLDGLSRFFALLISGVAACVLLYSSAYIREKPYAGRFYSYMLVFMGSMLGLVLADNLVTLYVFFEITSVSSFLLIGLESESSEARRASRQALIVTTAGGLALLAGVLLMGDAVGTYTISELLAQGETIRSSPFYVWIVVLVAVAAFTKSAQMPFHFWLPNAMVAPTPVSAFLHAAAMVKAGIYVLARFSPVLGGTELWTTLLTGVGGFTMLAAGWIALREVDLKRVLAYATITGLGLMILLLGVGTKTAVEACLTYVLVHACYKAALFMTAGDVQRHTGTRDVRQMGGLRSSMPGAFVVAVLAGLSMAGMHPLLGAIAKDHVYESLSSDGILLTISVLASVALVAAAGIAALRPFLGRARGKHDQNSKRTPEWWIAPGLLAAAGLAFGLAPGLVDSPILGPAVSSTVLEPADLTLHLWKGLTPAFLLGLLTIGIGAGVYAALARVRMAAPLRLLSAALDSRVDRAYDRMLRTGRTLGTLATSHTQTGLLRHYLLVVFVAAVGLVGTALTFQIGAPLYFDVSDVRIHEWIIVGVMLTAAGAALRAQSRLAVILLLSTVSFSIGLIYLLFGAPDLAMTQLLVETLLGVLIVLAFVDLPPLHSTSSKGRLVVDGLIAVSAGAVVTMIMWSVVATPFDTSITGFYTANSFVLAHGRNIVNVILVDFRALDTMGEITVIAVAGMSIFVVLRHLGDDA